MRPQRPSRPKLYSFERYIPQRSQSPVLGLIASCRALHNIIGEALSPTPSPSLDTTMQYDASQNPFGNSLVQPCIPAAPRGANKRGRNEFEEDEESPMSVDQQQTSFTTPKRRRIIPLEIPPGLQASDYEALSDNNLLSRSSKPAPMEIDLPRSTTNRPPHLPEAGISWSDADDRLLVETVLSKLNLSSSEWNECAARLGKDKDSLGQRWRMLLCEGDVGLRRGLGRRGRLNLDILRW